MFPDNQRPCTITQDEYDKRAANLTDMATKIVNGELPGRGFGGPGGPGGRGGFGGPEGPGGHEGPGGQFAPPASGTNTAPSLRPPAAACKILTRNKPAPAAGAGFFTPGSLRFHTPGLNRPT
jgi:hypothetical protein